ncbi:YbaB/EbfC family nucleoid-associated protein [Helicobacter cappadocius]|uniref:Nucleoid-associated protein Q5I04_01290 n=1 Tax=Helicobacter cappadocius TaxID=3063998 RepID=A0AA90PPR6_9HELI|nr:MULTISPECIES: YbaB/EbfC family nucleoid-associated protein [unclassified Helicobacter]MDO7252554.1 YbaB/EbfC family nucleoid-associated protein [Helicobacter sp. faydin-H75]MDP2538421.1 YbaB/EbfC family nucleoid-associated protein [Helicobacter sp. faydin-H76]
MFDPEQLNGLFGNMQKELAGMEEKAKETTLTSKSGGGLVSVSVNGAGELVDIDIDNSLLEDKESLQILLISAINDAYKSVEENKKSMAMQMLSGLNPFGNQ